MLPEGILNACTLPLFVHYTGRAVRLQTYTVSDPQAMVVALRYFKLESWREGQLGFQRMGKWGYWGGCWTSRRANVNANETEVNKPLVLDSILPHSFGLWWPFCLFLLPCKTETQSWSLAGLPAIPGKILNTGFLGHYRPKYGIKLCMLVSVIELQDFFFSHKVNMLKTKKERRLYADSCKLYTGRQNTIQT